MDLLPARQALAIPDLRTLLRRPLTHLQPARTMAGAPPLHVRTARFRLPAPVQRTLAIGWQGRILIAGGLDSAGQSAAGVFALDPATGTLHGLGALPHPVHDAAGALIDGRLYVFGGGAASSSDAVQTFDPTMPTRINRRSASAPALRPRRRTTQRGHLPRRRLRRPHAAARELATRDGHHFTIAGQIPIGLRYPAVTSGDGKLLIAGGQTATGLSTAVYAFDSASGRVALLARLPAPVAHAAAIVRGGTLYVIGGTDATGAPISAISAINLSTHAVAPLGRAIAPRADAASVQFGATTFLIGGRSSHTLATVLEIGGAHSR